MTKPTVYLAGKIGKNDWRHSLITGLRGHEWKDGVIEMAAYTYVGPFFVSDDHGLNHAPNSHGTAAGYFFGSSEYTQHDVIRNNNASLEQASLVFVYITSTDCHGTLTEVGSALRAGQRVVIAFAPGIPHQDFWYAAQQADNVYTDVKLHDLQKLLVKEVER